MWILYFQAAKSITSCARNHSRFVCRIGWRLDTSTYDWLDNLESPLSPCLSFYLSLSYSFLSSKYSYIQDWYTKGYEKDGIFKKVILHTIIRMI